MTNKTKVLLSTIAIAAAFSAGRFSSPQKLEIREVEKVVVQERVVEDRELEHEKRVIETTAADGTKRVETIEIAKDRRHSETAKIEARERELVKVATNRPDWRIGAQYQPRIPAFQDPIARVTVERRIAGEVFVGVVAATDRAVGLSFTIGF